MDLGDLKRLIAPLQRRIMLMCARAVIKLSDDSGDLQTVQADGLADETRDEIPRVQEYGFTCRPKKDAECVVIFLGGNRDNGVVIATDDSRYRLKRLEEGEVALYTDEGDYIHFKRGKIIEVNAQKELTIKSPKMTLSGDLEVSGKVTVSKDVAVTGKVTAQDDVQGKEVKNVMGTKLGTHMHPTAVPGAPSSPTPGT